MEPIYFHFHKNDGILSKIIEWKTGSFISHVSIEVRGYHYNAYLQKRFYKTKTKGESVVESYSFLVDKETADKAQEMLESGLGKLYDVKSLFGFIINRKSQSRGRWYCSEIANHIFELIAPGEVKHRKLISPESLRIAILYFKRGSQSMYLPKN